MAQISPIQDHLSRRRRAVTLPRSYHTLPTRWECVTRRQRVGMAIRTRDSPVSIQYSSFTFHLAQLLGKTSYTLSSVGLVKWCNYICYSYIHVLIQTESTMGTQLFATSVVTSICNTSAVRPSVCPSVCRSSSPTKEPLEFRNNSLDHTLLLLIVWRLCNRDVFLL